MSFGAIIQRLRLSGRSIHLSELVDHSYLVFLSGLDDDQMKKRLILARMDRERIHGRKKPGEVFGQSSYESAEAYDLFATRFR